MRHFFALEVPTDMRQQIAGHSRRWRKLLGPEFMAHWYEPEDYHIKLNLLGDVPSERQGELAAAAAPVAEAGEPFNVLMGHPNVFPQKRYAKVLIYQLWPNNELLSLYQRVNVAMQAIGFLPGSQYSYSPRITVARCGLRHRPALPVLSISREQGRALFKIDRLVLMQTTLPETRREDRPIRYNIVHTFPFGDTHSSPA